MGTRLRFSLCAWWSLLLLGVSVTSAEKQVAGRKSRQASEGDELEGVWSPWSAWADCSQSCGVGVSERRRQCMPPAHTHQNWGPSSFRPPGLPNHTPVVSAIRPYYPSQYLPSDTLPHAGGEGQHVYSSLSPENQNAGLSVYRNNPGAAVGDQSGPGSPLYRPEFPPGGQGPGSVYRPLSYGPSGRPSRRPAGQGPWRGAGGGNRRSVSAAREATSSGSSIATGSSIRPGQFGYGRVPYSLPLHRSSRNTRHTEPGGNSSTTAPELEEEGQRRAVVDEGKDVSPHERESEERDGRGKETEDGEEVGKGRRLQGDGGIPAAAPSAPVETARQAGIEPDRRSESETHGVSHAGAAETRRPSHRNPGRQAERERVPHSGTQIHRHFPTNRDRQTERRAPPPAAHPYAPPYHRTSPDREPAYSFSPSLPHSQSSRLGPDTPYPNIWLLPHQQPNGEREGARQRASDGRSWDPRQNFRCSGGEKEYRRCSAQPCPGGTIDPRAEQCSAFNNQEFMDRLYDWEPFTEVGPEQQCELACRPAGFRFYVRQADTVRDGTPCTNSSANGVCVRGRCLSEGCDGILGSGLVRDTCGVCGGRGTSCRKVTGSFHNSSAPLGYYRILDIPPGATNINITERQASPNYLALRSGTGQSVVNGRWALDPPGEYKAAGTTFLYSRPRAGPEGQEEGMGEALTAPGPTTTLLQLYIIHHRQNPGIDYEFYIPVEKEGAREPNGGRAPLREISALTMAFEDPIPAPPLPASSPSERRWSPERSRPRGAAPNRNARIPPRTDLPLDTQSPFVWRRGGFTECSVSCGKGSQHRVIYCVNRLTEQEMPDRRCDAAAKPAPEEEPCNIHPCPPFWEMGAWSECSVSCGWGVQQRQLQCRQSFGNRSTMVHPQRCSPLLRPNATQPCHPRICSHWEIRTNWSSCSVDCGVGKRTRNVRCVSNQGNIVSDRECSARLRPQGSDDCHMGPCVTNWYFTDWTQTCSAQCGPGVQRREVVCLSSGGAREGAGGGDCTGEKPADMKSCSGGPCVPTTMWYTGPWGQCSALCGNGTQRRDIICVQKLGSDFSVMPVSQCAHLEKPSPIQTCEMGPCSPLWFTTEWTVCSRSCGKGVQTREVRCLTPDKRHSSVCDRSVRPDQEQSCNTLPCSPQVPDENCRDKRHNCVTVVQARLCVYSYYKAACCASCTQSTQRAKRH